MKRLFPVILFLAILWIVAVASQWVATPQGEEQFADRVNLALRQVGHELLSLEGDKESAIPPVKTVSPQEFRLELAHAIRYDTLPFLVNKAFKSYRIERDYQVVVESCDDDAPVLGYNLLSFTNGDVPCVGREQVSECSNIVVTFAEPARASMDKTLLFLGLLILAAIAIVGFFLWKKKSSPQQNAGQATLNGQDIDYPAIAIGKFTFDHQNQVLQLGDRKKDLTFRESKLLHQLAQHINEVQTRDTLINQVWADEGVLVGRSLDVFISRLRKLLKADAGVSIRNIHGVGYRLEVGE